MIIKELQRHPYDKYFFCAIILTLLACKTEITKYSKTDKIETNTLVEITPLDYTDNYLSIRSIGRISTDKQLKLSFKIGGIISHINVEEGDYVEEGQILSKIRTQEIDAQVLKANRAFQKSERDLNRLYALYADSAATLEALQDMETMVDIKKADKEVAIFNQTYASITSPVSGRVIKRTAEPNELIAPGEPILIVASSSGGSYIMKSAISDKFINKVAYKNQVYMTFDAFEGEQFKGRILRIDENADPVTGMFNIDITIDSKKRRLRNGMIGRIMIKAQLNKELLRLPIDAIVEANDNEIFFFAPSQNKTLAQKWSGKVIHVEEKAVLVERPAGFSSKEVITTGSSYLFGGDSIRIKRTIN